MKAEASLDEKEAEGKQGLAMKAEGEFLAADQGGLFCKWKQDIKKGVEVSAVMRTPEVSNLDLIV